MAKATMTHTSLDALLAAVSDGPDIAREFEGLKATIDRVGELQRKAQEAHGTDYHGAIKRTRETLNATAAMYDIGRATLEELQAAKAAHAAAVEALELAPGRMAVFQTEIDAAATLLSEKLGALTTKLAPWVSSVGAASDRAIADGLALVMAGLQARALQDPMGDRGPAGIRHLIAMTNIYVPDHVALTEHQIDVPETVTGAHSLMRETERKLDALAEFDARAESMRQRREADLAAGIDRQAAVDRMNHTPYTVDANTAPAAASSLYQVGAQSGRPG